MSKIALYIRLSVEDMIKTDESESIINQRAYLNDYLDKNEEFKNFTREEFDNLSYIYSYLDGYMIQPSDDT